MNWGILSMKMCGAEKFQTLYPVTKDTVRQRKSVCETAYACLVMMAEGRLRICIRIVLTMLTVRYMMNGQMIRILRCILPLKREFCHKTEYGKASERSC